MILLNNEMKPCNADSVYPTVISHRVNIYLIRIIGASSRQNTRLSWLIDSHSIRFHGDDCLAPRLNKQNIWISYYEIRNSRNYVENLSPFCWFYRFASLCCLEFLAKASLSIEYIQFKSQIRGQAKPKF